jgi:hypothetical protein
MIFSEHFLRVHRLLPNFGQSEKFTKNFQSEFFQIWSRLRIFQTHLIFKSHLIIIIKLSIIHA